MDTERFHILINRHLDDSLTPEERQEFDLMLLTEPQARTEFWRMAKHHAGLRAWGQASQGNVKVVRPRPAWMAPRKLLAVAAAAVAMFVLGSLWQGAAPSSGNTAEMEDAALLLPEQPSRSVAILRAMPGVVWDEGSSALALGEGLQPGWLKLKHGAVQMEFTLGARVVLEGPAEFQIVSSSEGFLKSGRLRAFVPEPAQGFRINSPDCLVVDHGTEFGFSVGGDGASEVHVFEGKVEVQPGHDLRRKQMLTDDQAVKLASGQLVNMVADRDGFLDENQLGKLQQESARTALDRWKTGSDWVRQHKDTVLYFDFQKRAYWDRALTNQALHGPQDAEASIVGCDWVEGRWGGKDALEFKRPGDRVRVSLPGTMDALTLIAWVRVDSLPRLQNSLLMGDSFRSGEAHWFLSRDGGLSLSVRNSRNEWMGYKAAQVVKPEARGSWLMLASVFYGHEVNNAVRVAHYCNGRVVSDEVKTGPHSPVELGTFELGNWAVKPGEPVWSLRGFIPRHATDHIRYLQGRIDELAVLKEPLSAEEITRLYQYGRVE